MLKRTNKSSKTIEDRLEIIQKYHWDIMRIRKSRREDRPDQPRDAIGGRFAWSDTYSMDEHPVELLRNMTNTYDDVKTQHVQIKFPKGSGDQRFCSGLLTFRAVCPQNHKLLELRVCE